jgi:prolyl-tRNA synthetase
MNNIGGQELLMSSLQPKELWEKTGRWATLGEDNMYQFSSKKDSDTKDIGLGITHEEVITDIASKVIKSYRDLPLYVYQIQTKFRNETRARFGLVRGREFLMKDLYSFNQTLEEHNEFYETVKKAYLQAFKRVGLKVLVVDASGGVFSKDYSHEFQVLVDTRLFTAHQIVILPKIGRSAICKKAINVRDVELTC